MSDETDDELAARRPQPEPPTPFALLEDENARLRTALSTAETREAALRKALETGKRLARDAFQPTGMRADSYAEQKRRHEAQQALRAWALASPAPPVKEGA